MPGTQDARRSGSLDSGLPGIEVSTASCCFCLLAGRPGKRGVRPPGRQGARFWHWPNSRRPNPSSRPAARTPGCLAAGH